MYEPRIVPAAMLQSKNKFHVCVEHEKALLRHIERRILAETLPRSCTLFHRPSLSIRIGDKPKRSY